MKTLTVFVYVTLLTALCAISVWAGDFVIVPGKRIGSVALGMRRASVHKALGLPRQKSVRSGGIVQEAWTHTLPPRAQAEEVRRGTYWKDRFVSVWFKNDRVVQIAVNSPQFATHEGFSTDHTARFAHQLFRPFRGSNTTTANPSPGGVPATKHFVCLEDAARRGIAWQYGVWGNLAPEPDPTAPLEIVLVHLPDQPVLPDPKGNMCWAQTR